MRGTMTRRDPDCGGEREAVNGPRLGGGGREARWSRSYLDHREGDPGKGIAVAHDGLPILEIPYDLRTKRRESGRQPSGPSSQRRQNQVGTCTHARSHRFAEKSK